MEWNQIIPEFDVFNLDETLHFYVDLIGFHVEYDRPENRFAFLQSDSSFASSISLSIISFLLFLFLNSLPPTFEFYNGDWGLPHCIEF